jgi:hypothetical protein
MGLGLTDLYQVVIAYIKNNDGLHMGIFKCVQHAGQQGMGVSGL